MSISPTNPRIYDEIIDFLASGTTPNALIGFQLSDNVKEHVGDLIFREKNSSLIPNQLEMATVDDPPKSPLIRGTLNPVPPYQGGEGDRICRINELIWY